MKEITVSRDRLCRAPAGNRARLDRFLSERIPQTSRQAIARAIRQGRILVNEAEAKPSQQLRPGDRIRIEEYPLPSGLEESDPGREVLEPEPLPLRIIHEDRQLMVIDKAPGMTVHPGAGRREGTLVNALLHHRPLIRGVGPRGRPGVVHRLDKDTSGLLLVAKDPLTHRLLSESFKARLIHKEYLALAWGLPHPPQGLIDLPVGRSASNRKKMSVLSRHGREARTEYRVERRYGGFSLIRLVLHTGRTHQIRGHLAHLGHAVVGDQLYGGRRWRSITDPALRELVKAFPRQALHACRLRFTHPRRDELLDLQAPLPADLVRLIEKIRTAPPLGKPAGR